MKFLRDNWTRSINLRVFNILTYSYSHRSGGGCPHGRIRRVRAENPTMRSPFKGPVEKEKSSKSIKKEE